MIRSPLRYTNRCVMSLDSQLVYDASPEEKGWYATVYCWDPEEGGFPGGLYWNGTDWYYNLDQNTPRGSPLRISIGWLPQLFHKKEDAEKYASKNLLGF